MEIRFLPLLIDKPAIDVENWWARLKNKAQVITAAASIPESVMLVREDDCDDLGPDVVSYRPPPHDVETPEGGHAAPFEDFPVEEFPPKGGAAGSATS